MLGGYVELASLWAKVSSDMYRGKLTIVYRLKVGDLLLYLVAVEEYVIVKIPGALVIVKILPRRWFTDLYKTKA